VQEILGPAIPAIVVIIVILAFEEWAYFKARSKLQRAIITGVAVFLIVLAFNLVADPTF
jgi:multisubunit Na+/H+ antiporter MnhB subunit